jgi:hypothetical protein
MVRDNDSEVLYGIFMVKKNVQTHKSHGKMLRLTAKLNDKPFLTGRSVSDSS